MLRALQQFAFQSTYYTEQNLYPSPLVRPCQGGSHVARLNFKTSCVSVYKCLSLIVGFALTVPICWPREVVSCHDFILHTVATFWAMHTCQLSRIIWESPGYDTNLPVSRTGHHISRIKSSFELFCALV